MTTSPPGAPPPAGGGGAGPEHPGGPQEPGGPAEPQKTSGFAIASFVFGLIGGVLLSVIFGLVALRRIRTRNQRGRGFAIAGLVLSSVWVLLIVVVVVVGVSTDAERDPSGRVQEGGSESVFDLRVGDCANDVEESAQEVYGLEFRRFVPVDIALRHEVLTKGQADVSIVFTTDPQIQREEFVLLEDDKGMFPPYNSTLVMRNEIAEQGGAALEEVVTMVNEGLTAEAMQELNARVDLDKKTPAEVAGEYLSETGLVQ